MQYQPTKNYLLIEYPYNINFIFHEETILYRDEYCLIPSYVWSNFLNQINNDTEFFDERQHIINNDNEIDYSSDDSL